MGSFYKRTFHSYHSWALCEIRDMILDWLSSSNKIYPSISRKHVTDGKLKVHCSDKNKSHQVLPQDYYLWHSSAWTSAVSFAGAPYPLRHPTEEHTSSSVLSLNTSLDICMFATLFSLSVFEGGEKKKKIISACSLKLSFYWSINQKRYEGFFLLGELDETLEGLKCLSAWYIFIKWSFLFSSPQQGGLPDNIFQHFQIFLNFFFFFAS